LWFETEHALEGPWLYKSVHITGQIGAWISSGVSVGMTPYAGGQNLAPKSQPLPSFRRQLVLESDALEFLTIFGLPALGCWHKP
jgi:hypothetical protein